MGREYILIVDDEPMIRQQAEAALKVMGYRTLTAANGLAALELFQQNPPDVLLTDIRMPDMDGMELYNQVRKLKPDIVTVFMTAYGSIDNVVKSMQMGVSGFLLKPFTGRELERALSDALERSRQVQEATRLHLLSPLFQLRRLMSEETELGKVYRTMVGIVAQSCKADFCAIFLPEATGSKNLVALASYSNAAAQNFSSRTFPAAKVAARTIESNRTLILRRAAQTDRLPEGEIVPGAVICTPLVVGGVPVGAFIMGRAEQEALFSQGERELFEVLTGNLALLLENRQAQAEGDTERARYSQLANRFSAAEEDYKRQMAQQIQQQLLPVLISSRKDIQEYIQKTRPAYATDLLKIEERLHALINDSKRLSNRLHPASLNDFGLSATLRQYVRDLQENNRYAGRISFRLEGEETPRLERSVELALFRAVQDALEIAGPPAYTAELLVRLTGPRNRPDNLEIIISSSHPGFEGAEELRLLTFKERVAQAGATNEIKSATPDNGTQLIIRYTIVWELPPA